MIGLEVGGSGDEEEGEVERVGVGGVEGVVLGVAGGGAGVFVVGC